MTTTMYTDMPPANNRCPTVISGGIKQHISGDGLDAVYESYYETQVLSVGLTYDFR